MEVSEDRPSDEHVIDIEGSGVSSSSSSSSHTLDNDSLHGTNRSHDGPSHTSNASDSRDPWSLLTSNLSIAIWLLFSLGQIIAAVVVLAVSKDENPSPELVAWIVLYAAGYVATLPLLYWFFRYRETLSYTRFPFLVDLSATALYLFFSFCFIIGCLWLNNEPISSSDAPNLYWLFMIFLTISGIWFAIPFILITMIKCRVPFIISIVGVSEDKNCLRGASEASISALPKHKFKLKKTGDRSSSDTDDGGVVVEGTETMRIKDEVCCICLATYVDDDELRELPCSHFFHCKCVDNWLRINASCPLCKHGI